MHTKKSTLLWLALGACAGAGANDKVYLQADFNSGIPSDFILLDYDDNPVLATNYNRATTSGSWAANIIDTKTNRAAFSFSSTMYDFPAENWMITPVVSVGSPEALMRWRARSLHADFPENYKVMVSPTGSADPADFTELLAVEGEGYMWQRRAVSLADYVGSDIRLAFVATSPRDRFILAVDDIFVGEPSDSLFFATDTSRRFAGVAQGTAPVSGTVTNLGRPIEVGELRCVTEGGTFTAPVGQTWAVGGRLDYSFDVPVELNKFAVYSIEAVPADGGSPVAISRDSVFCSYFPQTMLIEEGTATWCNNCPMLTVTINTIKERYGDDALVVTDHARDMLLCPSYYMGLSRWVQTLPGMLFNRDASTLISWNDNYRDVLARVVPREVTAYVDLKVERSKDDPALLSVSSTAQFAKAYDNSEGRYAIGFGLVEKVVESNASTIQENSTTLINYPEYYYLPVSIPEELQFFHNVSRDGTVAFSGVEGSLPAAIDEGGSYDFDYEMTVVDSLAEKDDLFVVAYIIDTASGRVLNVARADVPSLPSGISAAADDKACGIEAGVEGSRVVVDFPMAYEPYSITLCDLSGRVLKTVSGSGTAAPVAVELSGAAARCVVVNARQGGASLSRKIAVR